MPVTIKIGALPNASVKGRLEKIWLKAHKQEQATVFPIEIVLTEVAGATLRAGYSANAEVIISRRDSVLYIPERLIIQRHDSSFVTVRTGPGKTAERAIKTGLSDAINVEVLEGLQVTDSIVEPPRARSLEVWRDFLADLRAQKLRTSLTVLGIAWGTVAVVVLLAFGVGLERQP